MLTSLSPEREQWNKNLPHLNKPQHNKVVYTDEQPQQEVTLPEYWIAEDPITVAQFRAFVEATGYADYDKDALRAPGNHPVLWIM